MHYVVLVSGRRQHNIHPPEFIHTDCQDLNVSKLPSSLFSCRVSCYFVSLALNLLCLMKGLWRSEYINYIKMAGKPLGGLACAVKTSTGKSEGLLVTSVLSNSWIWLDSSFVGGRRTSSFEQVFSLGVSLFYARNFKQESLLFRRTINLTVAHTDIRRINAMQLVVVENCSKALSQQ